MSVAEFSGPPAVTVPARKPKPLLRPSTIIVGLVAMLAFSFIVILAMTIANRRFGTLKP